MSVGQCPRCQQPRMPEDASSCRECSYTFASVASGEQPPFVGGSVRVAGPIPAPDGYGGAPAPEASGASGEIGQKVFLGGAPTVHAASPAAGPTIPAPMPPFAQVPRVAGPQSKPGATTGIGAAPKASPIQTTPMRAIGVTVGISSLAAAVVFVLWRVLTNPDPNADHAFFQLITSSHRFSPVPTNDAVSEGYTTLMSLLISVTPVAVVGAYWFSLRRLYQEWKRWRLWLKTFALTCAVLLLSLVVTGVEVHADLAGATNGGYVAANLLWAPTMLLYYPALLALALLAAAACTFAGIQFGRWFAHWPLDRIRGLQSDPWQDAALVGGVALVGIVVQLFLYRRMDTTPYSENAPFALWIWWVPLAALGIAAYACWHALRPLNPTSK